MNALLKNSILDLINNYKDFFLNKNNINGIGLGYKSTKNITTNEPCLAVFVENKIPSKNLYKHEIIPENFLGIKTDVVQSSCGKISNSSTIVNNSFKDKIIRPIQPGYSIGPIFESYYGTLGAIVFDNDTNDPYILSNNHVIGATNRKSFGTKIVQPGNTFLPNEDGFYKQTKNTIAYLYKKIILRSIPNFFNTVDCAIAKILPNTPYNSEICKIGKIKGFTSAKINMKVKKTGAKTEYTTGNVRYINSIHKVNLAPLGSIMFEQLTICDNMSDSGDSGSVVLDSSNRVIGLLFAGNGDETFLCSINPILEIFNVHF